MDTDIFMEKTKLLNRRANHFFKVCSRAEAGAFLKEYFRILNKTKGADVLETVQERIDMINNALDEHYFKPLELGEGTEQIHHVLISRFITQFATNYNNIYIKNDNPINLNYL